MSSGTPLQLRYYYNYTIKMSSCDYQYMQEHAVVFKKKRGGGSIFPPLKKYCSFSKNISKSHMWKIGNYYFSDSITLYLQFLNTF